MEAKEIELACLLQFLVLLKSIYNTAIGRISASSLHDCCTSRNYHAAYRLRKYKGDAVTGVSRIESIIASPNVSR